MLCQPHMSFNIMYILTYSPYSFVPQDSYFAIVPDIKYNTYLKFIICYILYLLHKYLSLKHHHIWDNEHIHNSPNFFISLCSLIPPLLPTPDSRYPLTCFLLLWVNLQCPGFYIIGIVQQVPFLVWLIAHSLVILRFRCRIAYITNPFPFTVE